MKAMGVNTIRLEGHIMPRRLLPADGRGRHPGQRRLPVLRRLGGDSRLTTSADYQVTAELRADHRAEPAQPPERVQLPVERQRRRPPSRRRCRSAGFAAGRLPGPVHLLRRVQAAARSSARPGEKEGPYDWVPPNYWYDTTHFGTATRPDQRRRRLGLRQRAERRQHRPHPGLDQPVHVRSRPGQRCGRTPKRQPVPQQLRGALQAHRLLVRHPVQLRHRDRPAGTAPGRAWRQYVEEAQAQNYENTRAQFEAFIDHSNNTPRPPPAPSTGR